VASSCLQNHSGSRQNESAGTKTKIKQIISDDVDLKRYNLQGISCTVKNTNYPDRLGQEYWLIPVSSVRRYKLCDDQDGNTSRQIRACKFAFHTSCVYGQGQFPIYTVDKFTW